MSQVTKRPPTVAVPEGDELSPELAALPTVAMRAFVIAVAWHGMDNTEAARTAGYADDRPYGASKAGTRLARRDDVQAALQTEARKRMHVLTPKALSVAEAILDNPQHKDQARIALSIMDRTGLHQITESHVHQHQHLSETEMDRRILALCAELGMSPDEAKKMLIAPAEFKKNSQGVFVDPAEKISDTDPISNVEPEPTFEPDFTPVTQEELDSY
jgi:hypothetical protein